jgi:hypothetical protein
MSGSKTEKYRKIFEQAAKEFVVGKRSEKDFLKVLNKLDAVTRKENAGINLDFHDVESYIQKRNKNFKAYVQTSSVEQMSKKYWKMIKKEAGIKKSGFLKKADGNVGSNIEKYGKLHANWANSAVLTAGGDHKLLQAAIKQGEVLKNSITSFVNAKEFKTELAKDLQKKCETFVNDLNAEITRLKKLQSEAHDPTATLKMINQLGMGQFKV